jgi:hypothetical protein
MVSVWDRFREISAAAGEWEAELQQTEHAIEGFENELQHKSDVYCKCLNRN